MELEYLRSKPIDIPCTRNNKTIKSYVSLRNYLLLNCFV